MTELRSAAPADAPAVAAIYNHYVEHTVITFEEQPVAAPAMAARIEAAIAAGLPWRVAEQAGRVVGYAYGSLFRERSAYRHTCETTVYLAHDGVASGSLRGIGSRLYADLFPRLVACGMHLAVAVIALPNAASVALHEKFGMRHAGTLREVGRKFDRWIDVGYWQVGL